MTEPEEVPDLYRLAYMPGQFRCPKCSFQWSIQTINVVRGEIGTTEADRQTPDCPNDGTRMVCVTYREQLEAYADRLKEEFDNIDLLKARIAELEEAAPSQPQQESRAGFESWFAREYPDAKLYWADADSNWCYSIRTLIDPQPLWEVWQASRAEIVAAPSQPQPPQGEKQCRNEFLSK